ncbi:hypothetical protein HDU97_008912 [Phlyctochytrium planicorne]|nr:hypothetical protein HDU97_008912 [Phlyctochytrium planicorne]
MLAIGISTPLDLYKPFISSSLNNVSTSPENIKLEGRDDEMNLLSRAYRTWQDGQRSAVLITGKSGYGKTQLAKAFISTIEKQSEMIVCFGSSRESRDDSNFVYQQILSSISTQLIAKGWDFDKMQTELKGRSQSILNRSSGMLADEETRSRSNSYASFHSQSHLKFNRSNAKFRFFESVGVRPSHLQKLQRGFPDVFGDYKGTEALNKVFASDHDVGSLLIAAIFSVFKSLLSIGVRVILMIDDVQWMDSGSLETTLELIQKYPNIFIILTSRPQEEFRRQREFYDKIAALPSLELINLLGIHTNSIESLIIQEMRLVYGFDIQRISKFLLEDITARSQGNPMVLKLLCKFLSTSSDVKIRKGALVYLHNKSQEEDHLNLPIDSAAAVSSSLDKMSPDMQLVIRIASVAGQFFTLNELSYCLNRLHSDMFSMDYLKSILGSSQKHGIITAKLGGYNDDANKLSFQHYLIYQGIYESVLPSRREQIHAVYADFFESSFKGSGSSSDLSTLLYHLLKLPGQEGRKKVYVRKAFMIFADLNRPVEARLYLNILTDLEELYPEDKTVIQQMKELRLRGLIERELGNVAEAKALFIQAYNVTGLRISYTESKFAAIRTAIKCFSLLLKLVKLNDLNRYTFALVSLQKLMKNINFNLGPVILALKSQPQSLGFEFESNEILAQVRAYYQEIRNLTIPSLSFMLSYGNSKVEVAIIQVIAFIVQCVPSEGGNFNGLGSSYISVAFLFNAMGKYKLAGKVFKTGSELYDPTAEVQMSRQSFYVLYAKLLFPFVTGDYRSCLSFSDHFIEVADKVFGGSIPTTHIVRLKRIMSLECLGELHNGLNEVQFILQSAYLDYVGLLEVSEIEMYLAIFNLLVGRIEAALAIYNKNAGALNSQQNSTGYRTILFAVLRLTIEAYQLQASGLNKKNVEAEKSIIESTILLTGGLKLMAPIQVQKP